MPVSKIQPYRNDRLRSRLQKQIVARQELSRQTPEILYPQPIEPSDIQRYNPRQPDLVIVPRQVANGMVNDRLGWLTTMLIAGGVSVALVVWSIGWAVSKVVNPSPDLWIRTENVKNQ